MSTTPALRPAVPFVVLLAACAAPAGRPVAPAVPPGPLSVAESLYAAVRTLHDRIDVAEASGRSGAGHVPEFQRSRDELIAALAAVDTSGMGGEDRRALGIMRESVPEAASGTITDTATAPLECRYDAEAVAALPGGLESLRTRMYACYGKAQSRVVVGTDTLDRLSILGVLGRTASPARRRQLFLALAPVWNTMAPYGTLIAAEAEAIGGEETPAAAQARAAGLPPDSLEGWLLAILETWRDGRPDSLVEPWDWFYRNGRAARALGPGISRSRLEELNRDVYRALGADPAALRVRYDLEPREGKTPVAFATFGGRAPIEPWVFATYRTGGLDNLNELLHETGHAIHLAAIRTRPAFTDWPDSDTFTEAVAELVALDVYEPAWQQRWLGDSVPLADGLRGRYGGIVLDVAWALFELRMLRRPAADPDTVWAALTSEYLGIRAHPEWSWWAMRGQLIESPGYMMNYAAGAILVAALRARAREAHGPYAAGNSTWYGWIAPRLFRFGLERPSREVVEEFLGGPVSPAALLADMRRMARASRATAR